MSHFLKTTTVSPTSISRAIPCAMLCACIVAYFSCCGRYEVDFCGSAFWVSPIRFRTSSPKECYMATVCSVTVQAPTWVRFWRQLFVGFQFPRGNHSGWVPWTWRMLVKTKSCADAIVCRIMVLGILKTLRISALSTWNNHRLCNEGLIRDSWSIYLHPSDKKFVPFLEQNSHGRTRLVWPLDVLQEDRLENLAHGVKFSGNLPVARISNNCFALSGPNQYRQTNKDPHKRGGIGQSLLFRRSKPNCRSNINQNIIQQSTSSTTA